MSKSLKNLVSVADNQTTEVANNATVENTTYGHSVMDRYDEYGLTAERIHRNGEPTNFQMIVKNNVPVATFTKSYKVIPNELVSDIVNELGEKFNLVKGTELGSEAGVMGGLPDTLYGYKDGVEVGITKILVAPEPVNLNAGIRGADADNIRYGLAVGNSIDGSQALKAFGFSFRQLCSNMSYQFARGASMQVSTEDQITRVGANSKAVIASSSFVHRRSLKMEDFTQTVSNVLDYSKTFFEQLQKMRQQKIVKSDAQKIAKLPKTVWDKLDWMTVDKLGNVQLRKEPTKYQAWNDLTDILTHDPKVGYNGKLRYFNTVDALLVRSA